MYANIFSSLDLVDQSVSLDFDAFLCDWMPVQDVLVTLDPDQVDSFTFLQLPVPDAFPCLFQNVKIRVVCLCPRHRLTKSLPDSSSWPQSSSGLIGYLLPGQASVIIGFIGFTGYIGYMYLVSPAWTSGAPQRDKVSVSHLSRLNFPSGRNKNIRYRGGEEGKFCTS